MHYGFSFSRRYCSWLGLNWRETLTNVAKTIPSFKKVRISAYWDELEPKEGRFDFSPLQEELDLCAELGLEVLLTIGMKAQRWPEYYLPNFISAASLEEKTLQFLDEISEKFKDEEVIFAWQVENEPLDKSGPHNKQISIQFLQQEINLVRKVSAKPIYINLWGNAMFLRGHFQDALKLENINAIGIDLYSKTPLKGSLYAGPLASHGSFELFYHKVVNSGRKAIISELQAEPWENFDFRHNHNKVKSISVAKIQENLTKYHHNLLSETYLWGVEYWVWAGILPEVAKLLE